MYSAIKSDQYTYGTVRTTRTIRLFFSRVTSCFLIRQCDSTGQNLTYQSTVAPYAVTGLRTPPLCSRSALLIRLDKTALNRGRTDRISLTRDLDLDLWPWPSIPESYGHDLLARKSSRSTDSRFRRWEWKQTDRRTDGGDCITSYAMRSVTREHSLWKARLCTFVFSYTVNIIAVLIWIWWFTCLIVYCFLICWPIYSCNWLHCERQFADVRERRGTRNFACIVGLPSDCEFHLITNRLGL